MKVLPRTGDKKTRSKFHPERINQKSSGLNRRLDFSAEQNYFLSSLKLKFIKILTDLSPGLKLSQNYFITLEKRFFNQLPKIEVRSIFKFAVRFSENDIILQRPLNFGIFPNVIRFFLSPGTLIISFKVPLKAKLANRGGSSRGI